MSSMYPFGGAMTRPCMRCGTPLAPNESQCTRCGTYNPLPQGQQFGMPQQGAQGTSGPSWGTQPPQSSQFPQAGNGAWPGVSGNLGAPSPTWGPTEQAGAWSQNNLFSGQNQQPSQQFQQNGFAPPNGTGFSGQNQLPFNNSSSLANFQQNPNQSSLNRTFFNATQQNAYGTRPQIMPKNPARPAWARGSDEDDEDDGKKRPGAGVIVVIIVLLLAVVGGGAFGAFYFLRHSPTNTATTPPAIVTPSVAPLFSDSFTNNKAGWNVTNPAGAKVTLANNGKLVLESDNNELFQELLPGTNNFGDFRLDVDAGLTSGDPANGYGVYIRGASTQNSVLGLYYRFEVYGDGSFVIYKGTQNASGQSLSTPLKSSPPNDAIGPKGQINHLTIIAKGSQLTFIVNGTTVSTFTDNSYKSGTIALFVSNVAKPVPAGAQATFERLAIFPSSS